MTTVQNMCLIYYTPNWCCNIRITNIWPCQHIYWYLVEKMICLPLSILYEAQSQKKDKIWYTVPPRKMLSCRYEVDKQLMGDALCG